MTLTPEEQKLDNILGSYVGDTVYWVDSDGIPQTIDGHNFFLRSEVTTIPPNSTFLERLQLILSNPTLTADQVSKNIPLELHRIYNSREHSHGIGRLTMEAIFALNGQSRHTINDHDLFTRDVGAWENLGVASPNYKKYSLADNHDFDTPEAEQVGKNDTYPANHVTSLNGEANSIKARDNRLGGSYMRVWRHRFLNEIDGVLDLSTLTLRTADSYLFARETKFMGLLRDLGSGDTAIQTDVLVSVVAGILRELYSEEVRINNNPTDNTIRTFIKLPDDIPHNLIRKVLSRYNTRISSSAGNEESLGLYDKSLLFPYTKNYDE